MVFDPLRYFLGGCLRSLSSTGVTVDLKSENRRSYHSLIYIQQDSVVQTPCNNTVGTL